MECLRLSLGISFFQMYIWEWGLHYLELILKTNLSILVKPFQIFALFFSPRGEEDTGSYVLV